MNLFESFKIGKIELKNRFMRSATCEGTADNSGAVTDASVAFHRQLSRGGVGLIVTGLAFVSASGRSFPDQFSIHSDDMISGLKRLVQAVHRDGSKIAVQLAHSGTQTFFDNVPTLAVSKQPQNPRPHNEMTEQDIVDIIDDFGVAAGRARLAGFDAVQLHGAHSYLMCQFLSPLNNRRIDRWGGSIENRRRFHLEVIRQVRKTVGKDFPVWIKYGVQDEDPGGMNLKEGIETAKLMVQEGIDAIEVSAGWASIGARAANPPRKPGEPEVAYFRDRAAVLKRSVNVPVILVGGIRSLALAQDIIDSGDADMISMCRPFIREPDLVKHLQEKSAKEVQCNSCGKCRHLPEGGIECGQLKKEPPKK